jgi:hypothetical protein
VNARCQIICLLFGGKVQWKETEPTFPPCDQLHKEKGERENQMVSLGWEKKKITALSLGAAKFFFFFFFFFDKSKRFY